MVNWWSSHGQLMLKRCSESFNDSSRYWNRRGGYTPSTSLHKKQSLLAEVTPDDSWVSQDYWQPVMGKIVILTASNPLSTIWMNQIVILIGFFCTAARQLLHPLLVTTPSRSFLDADSVQFQAFEMDLQTLAELVSAQALSWWFLKTWDPKKWLVFYYKRLILDDYPGYPLRNTQLGIMIHLRSLTHSKPTSEFLRVGLALQTFSVAGWGDLPPSLLYTAWLSLTKTFGHHHWWIDTICFVSQPF